MAATHDCEPDLKGAKMPTFMTKLPLLSVQSEDSTLHSNVFIVFSDFSDFSHLMGNCADFFRLRQEQFKAGGTAGKYHCFSQKERDGTKT